MREQKFAVEAVDASRYRSWVQNLPLLSATYNLGMFYQANYSLNTSNQVQPGGAYTLQADYPLIDWGALDATKSLAFLKEQLAQNEAIIAYGNLCVQIRQQYHALIVQKAFGTCSPSKRIQPRAIWTKCAFFSTRAMSPRPA